MSTTKIAKSSPATSHEFQMLGARLRSVRFAEEEFLSLFGDHKDDADEPQGMQLRMQVSAGQAEFSRYPPEGRDVIEIPLDFSVIAEGADDGSDLDILTVRFFGGFVSSARISKATFKKSFDQVKGKFRTILYYAVRSQVQEIIDFTVLRAVNLPWNMQFDERNPVSPTARTDRQEKETPRSPSRSAGGSRKPKRKTKS